MLCSALEAARGHDRSSSAVTILIRRCRQIDEGEIAVALPYRIRYRGYLDMERRHDQD